jgi:predicted nucleic acid-binding protein
METKSKNKSVVPLKQVQGNLSGFRVVADTNVIIASELTRNRQAPNKEFRKRWLNEEFLLLYSLDVQIEYIKKLNEKGIYRNKISELLSDISVLGEYIEIKYYHLPHYPEDSKDISFILCAENGKATHLVSYDPHLLNLEGKFSFKILKTIPFLQELRFKLKTIK